MVLAVALGMSLMACGSDSETVKEEKKTQETKEPTKVEDNAEEENQETQVEQINLTIDDGSYVFKRVEKAADYEGKPAVIVYFDWTNTSGESAMEMTFHTQIFQNGIECDTAIVMDNEAISNSTKEIQDGVTLEVAHAFLLQDETSPLTLKVSELMDFTDEVYQEQELVLQ